MLGMTTNKDPGISGFKDIALTLGGGIKENSLMLVEGDAKTGKSVLCQHITYGVLNTRGSPVAYYSSEFHADGLAAQMSSLSLDASQYVATGRLKVFKIYSKLIFREPSQALKLIINHIERLPPVYKLVILDSPSVYLSKIHPTIKVDFLQSCKELCNTDRTIVLVLDSHVLEKKTRFRANAMSDYYLRLRSGDAILERGQIDTRMIKILEVTKICGADRLGQPGFKFEIKPGIGIQILPFVRIKV